MSAQERPIQLSFIDPYFLDETRLPVPNQFRNLEDDPEYQKAQPFGRQLLEAKARANQFRFAYVTSGLSSGKELSVTFDNAEVAHHGHHHARHVERTLQTIIDHFNDSNPEFFQSDFGKKLLHGMMLFPYFHDWDQQTTSLWNMAYEPEDQLHAKKGHALGAAVKMLALSEEYANAVGVEKNEAEEIMGLAAVMMMRHDEPGSIAKMFKKDNIRAHDINDPEELRRLFLDDSLDLTTLSRSQLLQLLKVEKQENGFMNLRKREWGLSEEFEQDFVDTLLDHQNDHRPILDLSDGDKQQLKSSTEIVVWSDLVDMVAPYWDAIFRTFQGVHSEHRPFSWNWESGSSIDSVVDVIFKKIQVPKNGNHTDNDVERILWEFMNLDDFSNASCLRDLAIVREFNKQHAIMGVMALREVGNILLNNELGVDFIDNIYGYRLWRLEGKAKRRLETDRLDYARYQIKVDEIEKERERIRTTLLKKKAQNESPGSRDFFNNILQKVTDALIRKYQVTADELTKYQWLVDNRNEAPIQYGFFDTDSLPTHAVRVLDASRITHNNKRETVYRF